MAEVEKLLEDEKKVASVPEEMEVPAPVEEAPEVRDRCAEGKGFEYIEGVGSRIQSEAARDRHHQRCGAARKRLHPARSGGDHRIHRHQQQTGAALGEHGRIFTALRASARNTPSCWKPPGSIPSESWPRGSRPICWRRWKPPTSSASWAPPAGPLPGRGWVQQAKDLPRVIMIRREQDRR